MCICCFTASLFTNLVPSATLVVVADAEQSDFHATSISVYWL